MWLITPFGFFSIVQKPRTTHLTIRARVRADLEQLKQRYLPTLGPIQDSHETGKHTDYRYRAVATHEAVADAFAAAIRDIGYDNFKSEVGKRQGYDRAEVYSKVWGELYQLHAATFEVAAPKPTAASAPQSAPKSTTKPSAASAPKSSPKSAPKPTPNPTAHTPHPQRPANHPSHLKLAYGTVLYDPLTEKILLRAPTSGYGGMKWTLPKGRSNPGESPEQTAIRETREETGVSCRLIAPIPGEYRGQTTLNHYWLAVPEATSGTFDPAETAEVRWVAPSQAESLIGQSSDKANVRRDLAVIAEAMRLIDDGVLLRG